MVGGERAGMDYVIGERSDLGWLVNVLVPSGTGKGTSDHFLAKVRLGFREWIKPVQRREIIQLVN